jgi:pyridoxine/pyridoxamine 5'-phosphate oxidase
MNDKKHFSEKTINPNHFDQFKIWNSEHLISGGEFRLHDRLTYTKRNNLWVIERHHQ